MNNNGQDRECSFVGIEVSFSEYTAVGLASDNTIVASERAPVTDLENPVGDLAAFIDSLKAKHTSCRGFGVAVPGLVRRGTGLVAYSTHIPGHAGVDIAETVKSKSGVEAVIENDANAAAYAEYKLGAGRGSRHMFYATIGRGVGGALIVDGRIWHGVAGFAGEFGYIAVNSDGMRLEDLASADSIVRRTRNRFHQDNTSSLNKVSERSMTIVDILSAASQNDDFARLMIERTGAYVGTAVAGVINLLNIETVVIGGPTMQAGELLLDSIIRSARELSFSPSFESTQILAGELGDLAAATGAALLASEK
jgi:glucokinase